jgi:hypothetical protein
MAPFTNLAILLSHNKLGRMGFVMTAIPQDGAFRAQELIVTGRAKIELKPHSPPYSVHVINPTPNRQSINLYLHDELGSLTDAWTFWFKSQKPLGRMRSGHFTRRVQESTGGPVVAMLVKTVTLLNAHEFLAILRDPKTPELYFRRLHNALDQISR